MAVRRVSMKDVAQHVGISRTTVSFVLNRRADITISEDTQQRVWAAAAELGYRPNAAAKSLAAQTTDFVGVVTDITTTPFAGGIIAGAQRAAWKNGKLLLIVSTEGDRAIDEAAFDMLLERRVEGVIYATDYHHAVSLPASAHEIPTVLVNCFDPEGRFPSIVPDEFAGGLAATERLLAGGHRRIGLINLAPDIPAAVGRRAGYDEALARAGITVDPALIESGHSDAAGGYRAAASLLERGDPPTALFCANDRMAMGAYDAIKERGLRIPDDIAVVGYDNQEIIASFLRPPLTTVALPFEMLGDAGVRMLSSLASAGSAVPPERIRIAGPLVERSSA